VLAIPVGRAVRSDIGLDVAATTRRGIRHQKWKVSVVPSGKVKWFDPAKGFGFLSQEDGPDVYVHSDALPEGVTTLKNGARVEFGIAQGRRGDQALQVRLVDAPQSVQRNQAHARRKPPEEMATIVEDTIRLLDGVGETYRRGRHPEAKTARPTAKLLRALADELEL
jgi:CspA family cold shock protein